MKKFLRFPLFVRSVIVLGLFSSTLVLGAVDKESWMTAGGSKVIYVQTDVLPMVDISVDFPAGSVFDPVAKQGVARMVLGTLDKGTDTKDENQISELFASIGTQLGGSFDFDRSGVTMRSLAYKKELDESVDLLSEILGGPSFPEVAIDRERESILTSIREMEIRPGSVAAKLFISKIYGGHPYGNSTYGTRETVSTITREDLLEFYKRHFFSEAAVITIVGDIPKARAKEISEKLSFAIGSQTAPIIEEFSNVGSLPGGEFVIENPASQAHVRIGIPGLQRGDPDYLALTLANQILGGGGMTSLLNDELREKRGLTYGVYSYFSPLKFSGAFVISFTTKKDQVWEAVDVTMEIANKFVEKGPTEQELVAAKKYFIGAFALNVDSNAELLDYFSTVGFYDLPLDYIDTFKQRVEQITLDEVRDALKRRVNFSNAVKVIVGPKPRDLN